MNQLSRIGFYFHIPFCPHICPYCDFTKTSHFQKKDVIIFFNELHQQLEYFLNKIGAQKTNLESIQFQKNKENKFHLETRPYATAYFGGGTPGLFKAQYYAPLLNKLKEYFILEEVTLETNPHTNYEKNFREYKSVGFDRITLGAQSLCSHTLKTLGRKHTPEEILKNLEWAKKSGFENIQVDLIYGLKKEIRTLEIEKEIETLYLTGATGISAYFLTLEKRTLFANSNLVDEENGVQEYLKILSKCAELNLIQVETSNFSRYEAKHNNLYWYGLPYIGVGTGAHGLLPASSENPYGVRYKIGDNIQSRVPGDDILIYQDSESCKNNFEIIYDPPRLKQEFLEESIFTMLRTPAGIHLDWLASHIGDFNIMHKLLKNAKFERALAEGKIFARENKIYLSPEEKIRGDAWALDFISTIF